MVMKMNEQEYPEEEEVKLVRPLAKIKEFIKGDCKVEDMRWALNDTFLVIVTSTGQVVIFDVLL